MWSIDAFHRLTTSTQTHEQGAAAGVKDEKKGGNAGVKQENKRIKTEPGTATTAAVSSSSGT